MQTTNTTTTSIGFQSFRDDDFPPLQSTGASQLSNSLHSNRSVLSTRARVPGSRPGIITIPLGNMDLWKSNKNQIREADSGKREQDDIFAYTEDEDDNLTDTTLDNPTDITCDTPNASVEEAVVNSGRGICTSARPSVDAGPGNEDGVKRIAVPPKPSTLRGQWVARPRIESDPKPRPFALGDVSLYTKGASSHFSLPPPETSGNVGSGSRSSPSPLLSGHARPPSPQKKTSCSPSDWESEAEGSRSLHKNSPYMYRKAKSPAILSPLGGGEFGETFDSVRFKARGTRKSPMPGRKVYSETYANFCWSGKLVDFVDEAIPFEILRGEVIPFFIAPDGSRHYFSGVDRAHREVGGFGGTINGRRKANNRRASSYRDGTEYEDVVYGSFREFTEESMKVFNGAFGQDEVDAARCFVVDNTFVVLIRVNIEPEVAIQKFRATCDQNTFLTMPAYRENCELICVTSSEIEGIARGTSDALRGIRVWEKFAQILVQLKKKYDVDF